jgi:hypothetical protein
MGIHQQLATGKLLYGEWCVLRVAGFVRIRMPSTESHRILTNPATKKDLTIGQVCGFVLDERRQWSPVAALGARSTIWDPQNPATWL